MKNANKLQTIVLILMILCIAAIAIYVIITFMPKKVDNKEQEKIKYNYILYERDSELYKDTFSKLKTVLGVEPINYDDYATYAAELFVIDFYTLNNKNSKNDIGGTQYLYNDVKSNFILKAKDTIYKYVGTKENRLIELPVVNKIELVKVEKIEYKIKDISYEAYKVSLKWEYEKDLKYDKEGSITLIKEDNKLYVVEKS